MLVSFERREQLTSDIWQYHFIPERKLDYIPGQYTDFHHLKLLEDSRGQMRTFSLTSLPTDTSISFAAKFSAQMSPYKHALQALFPGEKMRITDAMGDVVLPKSTSIPLVFVAGGLGIASFISIFRSLENTSERRHVDLFFARRFNVDTPFAKLTDRFPFDSYKEYVSPDRLDVRIIEKTIKSDGLVYISGSEKFVEGLRTELETLGIAHEQIIYDYFEGYKEL